MSSFIQARIEIIAIALTAIGKFLFYDILDQRLIYILFMFICWGSYLFMQIRKNPKNMDKWGIRLDNFRTALNTVLPFGLTVTILCVVIGSVQGTINIHWHILPIFILYPLFGTLQQILLMSLFAGNLKDHTPWSNRLIIVITSILFGFLHYPYWWLVIGTFVLALFYTYFFLKQRNVIVLGIFHGWLGAIFYYTVVDLDPFDQVFGPLLSYIV